MRGGDGRFGGSDSLGGRSGGLDAGGDYRPGFDSDEEFDD
jgi:hypothetical protein